MQSLISIRMKSTARCFSFRIDRNVRETKYVTNDAEMMQICKLMSFLEGSPSVFHACQKLFEALSSEGYNELKEGEVWSPIAGQRYVVRRGKRMIAAINLGLDDLATAGARVLTAHIDSPCLKLKRKFAAKVDSHWTLNVVPYGSPIFHTWQDRDLIVAGCAYVVNPIGGIVQKLVVSAEPLCRISSLAPHLRDQAKELNSSTVDATNLRPILGGPILAPESIEKLLIAACGLSGEKVAGLDLVLADAQRPSLIGLDQSYISAARLDNLFSSYCLLAAFCRSANNGPRQTQIAIWYDSEEIGSQTVAGARSDFLSSLISRLTEKISGVGNEISAMARANSVMLSVDMAHSENPGYPDRLDAHHMPNINGGIAIKYPAQGNYAEASELAAWFENACIDRSVPLQHFMYRTGHRAGASLGPIATTASGVRGFDVGAALMGMHSIREMGGRHDVQYTIDALSVFLEAENLPGITS
jgi:aspartyl aminopeptidase